MQMKKSGQQSSKSQVIIFQAIASSPTKTTLRLENPGNLVKVIFQCENKKSWHLTREREESAQSPRQASNPVSPNSSYSEPLPIF